MASVALNAQLVLSRQLAYLAEDDVFEQEEGYPQLTLVKLPDLKAITDEKARKCFQARLQAYDIISKVLEKGKAETISETQQAMYLSALKRELSPFLSHSFKKSVGTKNPSVPSSMVVNLQQYLAKMAMESLAQIMRSNLGVQFTRRSIGQVIRMLTNLIFQSEFRQLVLYAVWVFSFWNFDLETVPMVSRAMETLDRAEEATLTNQGWIPFWACSNWRDISVLDLNEIETGFNAVNIVWSEPQFMLASNLEIVLQGKTSSRLVSLVDSITFLLVNPEIHHSASIRNEAIAALQRLIRLLPEPMMALQHRWLHALYPSLFDTKLGPGKQEVALSILMEVSNHLSTQAPHVMTSHILLHCLSPPSSNSPNDPMPHKIYHHILEGFNSTDVHTVLKTVSIWGPLVLLLGEGLFKSNMINVMLKLLQTTFTHLDANIRSLSFQAWSFLLLAFSQTSTGLRIWKRLKLLHLPIIRAYTQEDNFSVLYAAFETHLQLISSVRSHMAVDWLVILAQPFQILMKNPLAHVKVNNDASTPATSHSSQSSASSLPNTNSTPASYDLSIVDRYCLLICRMLQNQDVLGSNSLRNGFSPSEPLKLMPYTSKPDETKKHKPWNMDIVDMERQMHHTLQKKAEEETSQQIAAPVLPSLWDTPSSHSFLSLVLSLIIRCVNTAEPSTESGSMNLVDLALARHLWTSLCDNLTEHMLKHSSTNMTPPLESSIRGIVISPQNILSWSMVLLCAIGSFADDKKQWSHFLEEAMKIATRVHTPLCHKFSNSSPDDSERVSHGVTSLSSELPSTFAQFCHWIIGPQCFDYSLAERTNSNPISSPEPPSVLRIAPYFGLDDLVSYCFEQLQADHPPFEQKHELWAKRSSSDRVSYFFQSFSHYILMMIRGFCETLPKANRALENVLHIFRLIPVQLERSVYSGLQNLSNNVLASQHDSSELTEVVFRLNMAFSISMRLSDILRDSIQETSLIYPLHLYHTTLHHSSPSRHQKSNSSSNVLSHGSHSKSGHDTAHHHEDHIASSSMEGIFEFEAGETGIARNSTTLPSTTFSASYSLALVGTFLPSRGKSSGSGTSHQTTTTSGATNISGVSDVSSSSNDSLMATETRHPRLLLRSILECIVHPIQLVKRLVQIISPLNDDAHPGSSALSASLMKSVLTKQMREELVRSIHGLVQMVGRITQTRSVDLALSNRVTSGYHPKSTSTAHLSIVFYMNLIQLLHQLRDITTFRQIDHLDASQASQSSKKSSKISHSMTHIRIWQLHFWYECFERAVDGFFSASSIRPSLLIREQLWMWKDVIATFTNENETLSKESSDLMKELASKVEIWKTARSKPCSVSETLSLSLMSKEDIESLMEMSIPDWSIIWSEKNALNLKSSSSSSNTSSLLDNPLNHIEFVPFGSSPHPDGTGDERMMSGWSKFCRRIACCFGMIWRCNLLLLKPKMDAQTEPLGHNLPYQELWTQSSESVLSVANLVLHAVLKMLEKWSYGYNLQLDLLPVVCWAVGGDSSAVKVSRSAQSLSLSLKKPMENVAGATLACISRCFASIAGTETLQFSDPSVVSQAPKIRIIPVSNAIQTLLNRTDGIWVVMFESKRAAVRKLACRTWSHSFGSVKHLTCLNPVLRDLILDAHRDHPDDVVIVDIETWKIGNRVVSSSIASSQASRVDNPAISSKMDVDRVEMGSEGDLGGLKAGESSDLNSNPTTLLMVRTDSSALKQPASLFPIDHKHRRDVDIASLEQAPELNAEPEKHAPSPSSSGPKSPFQTKRVPIVAASNPALPASHGQNNVSSSSGVNSPTASPHKVKLGFSNVSFVPQRTLVPLQLKNGSKADSTDEFKDHHDDDSGDARDDPLNLKPQTKDGSKETSTPSDKSSSTSSHAMMAPSHTNSVHDKGMNEPKADSIHSFQEWAGAFAQVAVSASKILEDNSLTIPQLVEAQQHALQLATAISQCVAKGGSFNSQ